ncbi:hypothetical protein ACWD04_21355 [Streptomyces sp. NPDC002911]
MLQNRLREAGTHLEHLAIIRKTVTALADRPEHPDYPRILTVFNETTRPLRTCEVCEVLGHEQLPKNIRRHPRRAEALVTLDILSEADDGSFTRKQ